MRVSRASNVVIGLLVMFLATYAFTPVAIPAPTGDVTVTVTKDTGPPPTLVLTPPPPYKQEPGDKLKIRNRTGGTISVACRNAEGQVVGSIVVADGNAVDSVITQGRGGNYAVTWEFCEVPPLGVASAQLCLTATIIPTLTNWGMIGFAAILAGTLTYLYFRRRRVAGRMAV